LDALDIENVGREIQVNRSDEKFYSTRRLSALVVVSDRRIDANRLQPSFRYLRVRNSLVRANDYESRVISHGCLLFDSWSETKYTPSAKSVPDARLELVFSGLLTFRYIG